MNFFKKLRDVFNPRPAPTSNVTPSTAQQRPGIGDYKSVYALQSDAAPGWDTIDRALAPLYGETDPWHWGTAIKHAMGGPDPIDGISAYSSNAAGVTHLHFCTYGFTSHYYDEEALGNAFSGYGFELTFRL